jgi:hypothetical protein
MSTYYDIETSATSFQLPKFAQTEVDLNIKVTGITKSASEQNDDDLKFLQYVNKTAVRL